MPAVKKAETKKKAGSSTASTKKPAIKKTTAKTIEIKKAEAKTEEKPKETADVKKKFYAMTSSLPNRVICVTGKEYVEHKNGDVIVPLTEGEIKEFKQELRLGYWQPVKSAEEGFSLPCFFDTDYMIPN